MTLPPMHEARILLLEFAGEPYLTPVDFDRQAGWLEIAVKHRYGPVPDARTYEGAFHEGGWQVEIEDYLRGPVKTTVLRPFPNYGQDQEGTFANRQMEIRISSAQEGELEMFVADLLRYAPRATRY